MDNQLLMMDCLLNEHQLISKGKTMPDFDVVVVYSGISKQLISTDFNNRTDELRVAGWLLQDAKGEGYTPALEDVKLRQISSEIYDEFKEQLPERFRKRAAHYYTEQARVEKGAKAWAEGD